MPALELTIRWLASDVGVAGYHGEDWPPSPSRVFRALLAGCCRPGGAGERGIEALRRLETVSPPTIIGPMPERLEAVAAAVPNNDGDKSFQFHQKGLPANARKTTSKLKTIRARRGWSVQAPVHYRWEFLKPDPDPEAFEQLAEGLTILGQGTDLAVATAKWLSEPARSAGHTWAPDEGGGDELLPVPSAGEIDRLTTKYRQDRSRVAGVHVGSAQELPPVMAAYRDPLSPPASRWQGFVLRTLDDRSTVAFEGDQVMRVAGMVRHAIGNAAKQAGLDPDTLTEIMGHGGAGRFGVLPIPNVGHAWADGYIRRVIVHAPRQVPEALWIRIVSRLTASELIDEKSREVRGMLVPITRGDDDRLLWRVTDRATTWTSATAVVLPGFDERRGKPRPEKVVKRLLSKARIPVAAVRRVEFHPAPMLPSVTPAGSVLVPRYLKGYPRKFITIEFHRPIAGPLVLGAGAGAGLGLLVHVPSGGGRKG